MGLRFRGVNIPKGAEITDARLELTGTETAVGSASLTIHGHAVDDSPAYVNALGDRNIETRAKTTANRTWLPATLSAGETYVPNVTVIIQEIVNRGGWQSGNALSFMIAGTGQRKVYSYDGSAALAPRLVVSYEAVNPEIAEWQRRLESALAITSDGTGIINIRKMASSGNIYVYSRDFNNAMTSLMAAYRVNSDPGTLAYIKQFMDTAYGSLRDLHHTCGNTTNPLIIDIDCTEAEKTREVRDGYRNYVRFYYGQEPGGYKYNKTDWHPMDEMMTHSVFAAGAYTLREAGYTTAATNWKNYLRDEFEEKWRARNNKPSGFPFLSHGLMHPNAQFIRYHFYMHKLTGDSAYRTEAERMAGFVKANMGTVLGGNGYEWPHEIKKDGTAGTGCQSSTYIRYTMQAFQDLAMLDLSLFDNAFMSKVAYTMANRVMQNTSGDPLTSDICGVGDFNNDWAYAKWPYAAVAPWDNSGRLENALRSAYANFPNGYNGNAPYNMPAMMILSLGR